MAYIIIGILILLIGIFLFSKGKKDKEPEMIHGAFGVIIAGFLVLIAFVFVLLTKNL